MSEMSVLEQLDKNLRTIGKVALARMQLGDALQMQHERALLQDWIGAVLEQEESSGDQVIDALQKFHNSQSFKSLRQARLVCYGLLQPYGAQSLRLLDDVERLTLLFKYLDRNQSRTRLYRKCYRGLLSCYFSYDVQSEPANVLARRNWEKLRDYLFDRRASLHMEGYTPEWIAALDEHPAILSVSPFWKYPFDKLQGDWSSFEEIQQRLEIGENSWFIRGLVLRQAEEIIALDDDTFKEYLDYVLLLLNSHPLYAGRGLAKLLQRYVACATQEESAPLRDFAIRLWGNPWLANEAQNWQCDAAAREMIALWLKRHLLHEFFALFGDDASKQRRMDFWELYCGEMQGMYFAMGRNAFDAANMDYFRFRNVARGLVVKLTEGAPDQHAFIMQFDRHHVVEFSRNSVAYFYDTRHGPPPFYFSEGWIKVGALSVGNALKGGASKPVSTPLRHQDNGRMGWEGRFAQEMGSSPQAMAAFCGKYRSRIEDLRETGGYQWIRPEDGAKCPASAAAVLQGWGFVWSPEEQGYFRAGGA